MSRWSKWHRVIGKRRGTELLSMMLMVVICSLAACAGGTTAHHPSATPSPTATPVPKGWSTIPSPGVGQEGDFRAVTALSATNGWAVGQYEGLDSLQRTLTERWDGAQWNFQPSPNPSQQFNLLQGVSGSGAGDVWAVGYQLTGSTDQPLVEHWDGNAWSVIQSPSAGAAGGQLNGVAAISPTNAWAVGFSSIAPSGNQPGGEQPLIMHWDGSAWSIVNGVTLTSQNNSVPSNYLAAVTALSANNVWAVGSDDAGAVSQAQVLVEHWNGHSWSLVQGANPGLYGNSLSAIAAVSPNDIWAVGTGELSVPRGCAAGVSAVIEHWNGSTWSSVSFPQPAANQGAISFAGVAAASSNDVWAVGGENTYNTSSGQTIAPVVEHWNGAQWSLAPSPVGSTSHGMTGVAAAQGGPVFTVGQYEAADGPSATLAEQEQGGNLSLVTSASPGTLFNTLHAVTNIAANDVWAVGSSASGNLAEHWNGTAWTVSTTPNAAAYDDSLNGVAASTSDDVWAVGSSGGTASIEHWNGSQWAAILMYTPQYSSLSSVVALSNSNAWAVGVGSSGPNGPLVVHWDGTKWSTVSTPTSAPGTFLNDDSLLGVAAASPNDIWAVGGNPVQSCGSAAPVLIEHWNGTKWSVIPKTPQGILYGVTAISANDVWAVGVSYENNTNALIMHWNGTAWTTVQPAQTAPHTYPTLHAVAAHGTSDVWAVGSGFGSNGSTQIVVEHWDGHAWSIVQVAAPGVADNSLFGITSVADGELWAVGQYDDCNGCGAQQALIEHYNP